MSREKVLERLRASEGCVSGQTLSEELGLSRAAVWKAVEASRRGRGRAIGWFRSRTL